MATIRQKKAVKALAENGGVVSRAMLTAGYSPMTAQDPKKLTDSDGFKELMGKYLSDEKLAKRHEELLDKREEYIWVDTKEIEGKKITVLRREDLGPDVQAVSKGLDMAYKIKDRYAADKHINLNIEAEASPELKELAAKLNELHRTGSK